MVQAHKAWLDTPESIKENRSYTTTQSGGCSRTTTTTHYYQVDVSNPNKAKAESFYRENKAFQEYLGNVSYFLTVPFC